MRLKRGYATVKEAAEALGMAYTTYTGYEKGERSPNNETLSMLASFFGVTTDYLLGRTEHPSAIHMTRDNLPKELVNAEIEWDDILEQQSKEGRIPKDEIRGYSRARKGHGVKKSGGRLRSGKVADGMCFSLAPAFEYGHVKWMQVTPAG